LHLSRAQEIQPELRAESTISVYGCAKERSSARGTGCVRLDAEGTGFVVSYLILVFVTGLRGDVRSYKNSFQRICYRPVHSSIRSIARNCLAPHRKWLERPYRWTHPNRVIDEGDQVSGSRRGNLRVEFDVTGARFHRTFSGTAACDCSAAPRPEASGHIQVPCG